jgi:hypothetical protein
LYCARVSYFKFQSSYSHRLHVSGQSRITQSGDFVPVLLLYASQHRHPFLGFQKGTRRQASLTLNVYPRGILLGADAAAILLQIAEPGVGTGVNEHSNFAHRVVDRLRTTMTFVYCISYGTPEEGKTIVDMATSVYSRVSGTLDKGRDKGKTCKSFYGHEFSYFHFWWA